MRVAVFVDHFPVISQTFILRQITGLLDLGHQVDIYAEWPEEDSCRHPEIGRYRLLERTTYVNPTIPPATGYWEMPVWPLTGRTWLPGAEKPIANVARAAQAIPTLFRCLAAAPRLTLQSMDPRQYGFQALSLSTLYRLAALCRRPESYDVAHAHFGPTGNVFRFVRKLWRAPLVVTFHGFDFSSWPRMYGQDVYHRLFEEADIVTVGTHYARERVEALGCPRAKMRRLPVGLDPGEFPFAERVLRRGDVVRVLTVARLVEIKGIEYAIRAVVKLSRTWKIRYDIVGDGPLGSALESLAQQVGADNVVVFHGSLDGESVRRMMSEAHLFVLPSVTVQGDQEGQGLVLQEAQASGLPVVATQHGGLPEGMVPGGSGVLVPERDVDALADGLRRLMDNPQIWGQMGRTGRAYVEAHYDIRRLNAQLVAHYREAIEAYRRSGEPSLSR